MRLRDRHGNDGHDGVSECRSDASTTSYEVLKDQKKAKITMQLNQKFLKKCKFECRLCLLLFIFMDYMFTGRTDFGS